MSGSDPVAGGRYPDLAGLDDPPSQRLGRPVALVGPTASGKSSLAMAVARARRDLELVSLDSMQVYRGMDIGTAKPGPAERQEVAHHLIDIVDPCEDYTVARLQADLRVARRTIEGRGHQALLVGGTGLYLRAAVDDLAIPGRFPETRARLESEPDTEALHARLTVLDPVAASRMEPTNRRRVVRALEVTLGSGRPFSSYGPGLGVYPPTRFVLVGLAVSRPVLDERIAQRFRAQMEAGLLEEVEALAARPGAMSRAAAQALGYKEMMGVVRGEMALEDAVELAIRRIRRFARRQQRWFGRDPRIVWIDGERDLEHQVDDLVAIIDGAGSETTSERAGLAPRLAPVGVDPSGSGHPGRPQGDRVQLTKHHGLGNDFLVVLDETNGQGIGRRVDGALAARWCHRTRGIGADGLIHGAVPGEDLAADDPARVDVVMNLFNADGSRAEMSGNGIRCLAQALAIARDERDATYRIRTDAGIRLATVHETPDVHLATVSVGMGPIGPGPAVPGPLAERLSGRFETASVGNPHLVVLVDDPASVDLDADGAWLAEQFPEGVNVEFVAVGDDPDTLSMVVWERGVGVTAACGTGACAAAHVAHRWGLVGTRVRVDMAGGAAEVVLGEDATLIGPAQLVATVEAPDPSVDPPTGGWSAGPSS